MSKKRESIWEKQASRKMVFICFLIVLATAICFGGTYLQYKNRHIKAPDEIWTDKTTTYDEKVEEQRAAEEEIQRNREGALTE